jgi:hypothetical protein
MPARAAGVGVFIHFESANLFIASELTEALFVPLHAVS